ncbi:Hypothetical protein NTJ_16096 [Nesidiocoris tenuis]|uniref:Uncharacterized protein n=1 Tax=Nesidiocoris tenuis TaxID=355587 RepID=A0ABN7BIF4_9HEMI|nr:Hypothetical protein NTJ_16096 [Nesidiocoris tenuis]
MDSSDGQVGQNGRRSKSLARREIQPSTSRAQPDLGAKTRSAPVLMSGTQRKVENGANGGACSTAYQKQVIEKLC